ncbi:unnamed protein product [Gordionus sp. m RMFG-2023]
MVATVANNLEYYLKIQNIKFEGTSTSSKFHPMVFHIWNHNFIQWYSTFGTTSFSHSAYTNLDSPLDIAQTLLDLNSNIYEARFVKSQKGKILLFFQNYMYRFHSQNGEFIKYRCRVGDCHAKCIYEGAYTVSGIHDHVFEIGAFEMLKTKEALENIIAYNPLETRLNISTNNG